eukprot:1145510-Pelagomonas_calceolata.AAC.12
MVKNLDEKVKWTCRSSEHTDRCCSTQEGKLAFGLAVTTLTVTVEPTVTDVTAIKGRVELHSNH